MAGAYLFAAGLGGGACSLMDRRRPHGADLCCCFYQRRFWWCVRELAWFCIEYLTFTGTRTSHGGKNKCKMRVMEMPLGAALLMCLRSDAVTPVKEKSVWRRGLIRRGDGRVGCPVTEMFSDSVNHVQQCQPVAPPPKWPLQTNYSIPIPNITR